jgi:site-specific recombinase XerD
MVRSVTTATGPAYRAQRLTLPSSERTWTVVGGDHHLVEPAEGYLEYLRAQRASPNTVKSYARALALWWQFLDAFGLRWDAVTVEHFGAFLSWLRTGDEPAVASIERRPARFAESTIAARLRAVISCYDYHVLNGVDVGRDLHRITDRGGGRYKPLLEHVARRKGRRRAVVRIRDRRRAAPPILTPQQIELICEACASWDAEAREWRGSVRNRLLWMLLAETGLRLGEALGLQHRDWHTGRGDTPFIEVVDREHPHGVRAKSGYRRLYVSTYLSTSTGSRGSRRGDRSRSTTWWSGCAAGWPGGCRRPGHHTGCVIRMPPRCCCRGCRCTWSVADSDTPTCRPRSPPTPT